MSYRDTRNLTHAVEPGQRPIWVPVHLDAASATDRICRMHEHPHPSRGGKVAFGSAVVMTLLFIAMIVRLLERGIGVWGVNDPVGWGYAIVNFVFWIGIAHAGTLISAILLLMRQGYRTSLNRLAETMTVVAVVCAAVFPVIHMGRAWLFYWMLPIPTAMQIWPNFRSPLTWDVFAIVTYFIVSVLFWYVGMVPDLATLRDRAATRCGQILYTVLAMGWQGSTKEWHYHRMGYLLLAGLATALVISVHSVVSFDFAVSLLPGWHTTILPPYFVAGAIFSGLAMVITLLVPLRSWARLEDLITPRHLESLSRIMLAMSWILAYVYVVEAVSAMRAGGEEAFVFAHRTSGPAAWTFWLMLICNVGLPQSLWSARWRSSPSRLLLISIAANVGMWLERLVIVVRSLARDFLPSSWGDYAPTWVDALTLLGSFGLFAMLLMVLGRYLPMVAIWEVRESILHRQSGRRRDLQP